MFEYFATLGLVIVGSILLSKICWYFIVDFLNDMPSQRRKRMNRNTKDCAALFDEVYPRMIEMIESMFQDEEES